VSDRDASIGEHRGLGVGVADLLVALAVGLIDLGGTYLASRHHSAALRPWDLGAVLLLAVAPIAVVFRRRVPVVVLAIVFASTFAYAMIGYPSGPHWAGLTVAFVTSMTTGHRRAAQASLIAGWVAFSWGRSWFHRGVGPSMIAVFGLLAWLLLLLGAAEALRVRNERAAEAIRMHEEEARRRASEERLAIAREVHDVVAHHMSLINVQASAALHVYDDHPEQARDALVTIKHASKQALMELRSVLGVLRRVDEVAPRSPTPGTDQLDELVQQSGAAGLSVHVATDGQSRRLPPAVDVAVYRIVQEALTNVTRYAATSVANVRIEYGAADVIVEVDDFGREHTAPSVRVGSGSGISGMRERATLLGGTLEAGRRPEGGFRVRAWFPLDGAE
jgi:signal transduction histidine kinase